VTVPTAPPIMNATTTKASQPSTAVVRCVALQCAARAVKVSRAMESKVCRASAHFIGSPPDSRCGIPPAELRPADRSFRRIPDGARRAHWEGVASRGPSHHDARQTAMTAQFHHTMRELHSRSSDGIHVRLLWSEY